MKKKKMESSTHILLRIAEPDIPPPHVTLNHKFMNIHPSPRALLNSWTAPQRAFQRSLSVDSPLPIANTPLESESARCGTPAQLIQYLRSTIGSSGGRRSHRGTLKLGAAAPPPTRYPRRKGGRLVPIPGASCTANRI